MNLVLDDGRILDMSDEQYERLSLVILLTNSMDKIVKVGDQQFSLNQIVTDPEEILRISQTKMFDVPTVEVKGKKKKSELA